MSKTALLLLLGFATSSINGADAQVTARKLLGQQVPQQEEQYTQTATTRDGTTPDRYLSYISLNGSQSAYLPLEQASQNFGDKLEYTVMLWFKPQSVQDDRWQSRYQYCLEFTSSLQCYFTGTNNLLCDSSAQIDKVQVDTSGVGNNQWTHLSLAGHPTQGSYVVLEQNNRKITQDVSKYITMQQGSKDWQVCLGGCQAQFGFIGSFREFKFINQFVTQETASRLKNHYLLYDQKLLAYYRFEGSLTDSDFMKDQFRSKYAQIYGSDGLGTKKLLPFLIQNQIQRKDLAPNDICFPITEVSSFLNVSSVLSGGSEIMPMTFDSRWKPSNQGWEYSGSLWVNIGANTCAAQRVSDAVNNCFLIKLQDSFMLYLLPNRNEIALYFFNPRPLFESMSKPLFVPQNQWINIQFGMSQYNGYDLRVYDELGRLIGIVSEKRDLLQQIVKSKTLSLFQGFNGIAKSVILFSSRKTLPLEQGVISQQKNLYITNSDCLSYMIFEPEHMNSDLFGRQTVVNYCKASSQSFLNATILYPGFNHSKGATARLNATIPIQLVPSVIAKSSFKVGQTSFNRGLITSSETLFDGIACDDGFTVIQFNSKSSFVKDEISLNQKVTQITIETWFNMRGNSNDGRILTVFDQQSGKEIMNIQFNSDLGLQCQAFDINQASPQTLTFETQPSQISQGWVHVSCSVSSQDAITGLLNFNDTQEESISIPFFRNLGTANSTIDLILGNSMTNRSGIAGLSLRDLRLWSGIVPSTQTSSLRHRQLNVNKYAKGQSAKAQLIAYYRLAEGDHSYFNLVNYKKDLNKIAQFKEMTLISDNNLLICPIGTYLSQNKSQCFRDPITVPLISIYPIIQDNGSMMWKITTEDSQLVNKEFSDEILSKWEFKDPILQSIAGPNLNQKSMMIPATAFRESSKYQIRLNLTNNGDLTLNRVKELTFVPVSCQYFLVNGQTSDKFYFKYMNAQSTENITFFLQLTVAKPYCSEIAFFKDLAATKLSYKVVYDQDIPAGQIFDSLPKPTLTYVWDNSTKRFIVTLPKSEQYKIPLRTDVKFIFSIPWMNSEHNDIFPASDLVFQNALVTMNFQKEGSVLIPFLDVAENVIMKDDPAIFNSSRSYLTYRSSGEKQTGLTFKWICPFPLDLFCSSKTENTLVIESKDFINAKATYNLTYTIKLRIEWTNVVNDTGYPEFSELQTQVKWINYTVPSFTLEGPSGGTVKVSAESARFQILLRNFELPDLSVLNVEWSIVPNISVQTLPLTFNKTLLTLLKGQLSPMTSYTISVTISNKLFKLNPKTQVLKFVTSQPPVGGTVITQPPIGIVGQTQFNLSIANWESMSKPLRYQVWSTSDSGGDTFQRELTENLMEENEVFSFVAKNSNPLIVLITDSNGEQARVKEFILYKAPPPKTQAALSTQFFQLSQMKKPMLTQSLKSGLPSSRQLDTFDKYEMITNFLEGVQNDSTATNSTNAANLTSSADNSSSPSLNKTEQYQAVLDTIKDDLANISAANSNLTQLDVQVIISNSVKLISSILNDTSDFLTVDIANKSAKLLDEILDTINNSTTLLPALLEADKKPSLNATAFVQDFSSCIGDLIVYTINSLDKSELVKSNDTNSTNSTNQGSNRRRRRFLEDDDPTTTSTDSIPLDDKNTSSNPSNESNKDTPSTNPVNDTTSTSTDNTTSTDLGNDSTSTNPGNDTSSTEQSSNADNSNKNSSAGQNSEQNKTSNITLANKVEESVVAIDSIIHVKDKFAGILCDHVKLGSGNQTIQNKNFMMILQKFNSTENQDNNDESLSYVYSGEFNNNITFNVSAIKEDLLNLTTSRIDVFCLQTTFYLFDSFQEYRQEDENIMMNLTQLSEVTAQVNLNWDDNRTATLNDMKDFEMKSYITFTYPIKINLTELNRTITNYTEVLRVDNATSTNSTSVNLTSDNSTSDNTTTDNNTASTNETSQIDSQNSTTNNITDSTRRLQEANTSTDGTNTTTTNLTSSSNKTDDKAAVAELVDLTVEQKIACMAFSRERQLWDESMCETEILYETNSVKCQCTSLDNAFQGVFLVNVPLPEEEVYENNSKPFVAITVFMALITVFVPFAASYLDMKDVSKASERELELKADQRKVHSKVLDIQPLLWYWFFVHGDDVKSSHNVGVPLKKLSLGDMIKLTHPLLNIITRYEGQRKSRFFRIMPWLGQLAIFTIVICACNTQWYDDVSDEQEVGSITSEQALRVIAAGFAGMFLLIPIPYMGQFVRRPSSETGRVKDEERATLGIRNNEGNLTPKGNSKSGMTKGASERYGTEEAMNAENSQSYHQKIASMKKMKENRKPSPTNRILAFVTIILCISAIVISVVLLEKSTLTAQRCTVASFFMGLFGSILVSHFLYSIWQYIVYITFYEETTIVPSAAQLEQGVVEVNESFIKKVLTDSAVVAHILEQAVIKRAVYDSQRPTSASHGKRKADQTSHMHTQFGGPGEGQSQFEPIASPNLIDGGKGTKNPDLLATGAMNKLTERGTLIQNAHAEYPDEEDEMHVYDDDNNPTHYRRSTKKTDSGPRPFNFETPYEPEPTPKAPLRSAHLNEVNGFVVEEAIGKEAVIRASQDGIDVSPITTNRNVMQLQDGGDDLQNYTSNGRLRISNEGTPLHEGVEFYATTNTMHHQKENPNTMNVSRGSNTSQKKNRNGIFDGMGEVLNNSQSKIVKGSNSFVRPGEGSHIDQNGVQYSPHRQIRPKTEEHFENNRPKANQAWGEDGRVETDMIPEENHALDEESAMARTQH